MSYILYSASRNAVINKDGEWSTDLSSAAYVCARYRLDHMEKYHSEGYDRLDFDSVRLRDKTVVLYRGGSLRDRQLGFWSNFVYTHDTVAQRMSQDFGMPLETAEQIVQTNGGEFHIHGDNWKYDIRIMRFPNTSDTED